MAAKLKSLVLILLCSNSLMRAEEALGISPRQSYQIERRPFFVTCDGLGKPIQEILA